MKEDKKEKKDKKEKQEKPVVEEKLIDILPKEGLIVIPDLAKWYGVTPASVCTALLKAKIHIFKVGKNRSTWSVRLEDIK